MFDLLEHEYERRLRQFESRLYLTPWFEDLRFSPGPFAPGAGWKELAQVKTVAEAENLVATLRAAPRYVDQLIAILIEGKNAGMLPSRAVLQPTLSSISELVPQSDSRILRPRLLATDDDEVTRSGFYSPFRSLHALAESDRTRVQKRARDTIRDRALPAMKKLRAFVNDHYLPACPDFAVLATWKEGPPVYRALVRQITGTSLDPEQIHEAGLREVARIRGQMEVIASSLGAGNRLNGFLQSLNADSRFPFKNAEDLIGAYKAALARIQALLRRVVRKLPRTDVRVVPAIRGTCAGAA